MKYAQRLPCLSWLDQPDFRKVFLLEQEAELQVNLNRKLMMSIYLSRSFPRSNSSFFLCSGNALQSEVLRLREEMFWGDAGPGPPRICMQDEPTGVPINRAARFENKVGSLDVVAGESLIKEQILERFFIDVVAGESLIKEQILERFFIDVVAGESLIKERAAARFKNLVGSTDVVAGEPLLLLPRRFRQNRAWMELNKIWRTNTKVRGFFIKKVKGGYSVAIAGFLTFLPFRRRNFSSARFTIERINLKRKRTNIVVLQQRRIKQELICF
ncbi:PREDICTED: ribosomal protein S1, mitochondrial-like [Prunus mume]|uniref:Ribosomal protein S1, mitochondrial-like n=1 Tax=Prunus mume TaxID=102107 RepID=A0ABM1LYH0_PRUMU|nr:PREDICTED: ribosomal protein S1, mitochondrial-like [Prunus mume]